MTSIFNPLKRSDYKTPVWLMRQAGRYLPEYMNVRKTVKDFLELCYNIDKATEVTLQPIRRFAFDAAIIFSDILVLPHALGWNVEFKENIRPLLQQFKSREDLKYMQSNSSYKLEKVYEIIKNVKKALPLSTKLIGFAGSPWTVMIYMLEGKGKQDFKISKKFIYENKELVEDLLDFITEKTSYHLINQIKAGADIVKIFDSWSGVLAEEEFTKFVIEPTRKIISKIKKDFPKISIIAFPKGAGLLYEKFMDEVPIDVLAVDTLVPLEKMKQWNNILVVQGNLDPVVLLTNKMIIKEKIYKILSVLKGGNFIFNLGHGILRIHEKRKIAIILFNLGGPDSLESVKPFLFNLFYDKAIIDLPNPFRYIVAEIISIRRKKKSQKIDSLIGGKSLLLQETEKQKLALSENLKQVIKEDFNIFINMRYASPFCKRGSKANKRI